MTTELAPDRLSIGMQLPIQSRSTLFAEPWEDDAGPDELARIARAADRAGFAYLGVCDHIAIPVDQVETMGRDWWDTVATIGWLAGITEDILLLSHVYVPAYRHPLAVAKAFSTLDLVSGGRIVMGVGAGHVEGEFEGLGVPFEQRGALLDEAIDALRTVFSEDVPTLPGPRWSGADLAVGPRPVQPDGPPIWVGGSSKAALRRAALRGDGWLPQGPVTAEAIGFLHRVRDEAGQRGRFDIGALMGGVHVGEAGWDLGRPTLTGEPDRIAAVLNRVADLGVSQAQIQLRSRSADELVEQIERFGADVLPKLVRS